MFSILCLSPNTSEAIAFKPFGGRIFASRAIEIQTVEAAGYVCIVPGTTVSIYPIGSTNSVGVSYFIPAGVLPRGGGNPIEGAYILGLSSEPTSIECVHPLIGPIYIPIRTVTLYGVSGYSVSKK